MQTKISFDAAFGNKKIPCTLDCNIFGGGSWTFECGNMRGKFFPTKVWGWRYDGDALETDEIQILIEMICKAEGIAVDEFNSNTNVPWWAHRAIFTREEWNRACASLSGQDNFFDELKAKYPNLYPEYYTTIWG